MQASTHISIDEIDMSKIKGDSNNSISSTCIAEEKDEETELSELDDAFIPYVLDIQQEDNISIEMLKLYQELLPSKESNDRRVKFVNLMERLMNNEWPDHDIKAHVFGSSVNDLGTSNSDVDLCITTPWNGLRNVRILAKLFRKCGMQHVVCVPRAKVPIVRLFDPELQLSCDINVNNTLALHNTQMIKTYVSLDPRVRPLIMTVKHWTKQRMLNDAANGGTLSSYTWTCMIINFLQQRNPPILPVLHLIDDEDKKETYFLDNVEKLKGFGLANKESLGGLLFAFFRRFAVEFDYDNQVVSVRHGRYLTKEEKGWDTGRNKMSLCVEEPFNVGRNLGNSADIASVRGLRCEFQRFLELLIAGETLDTIFTPYQPLLLNSNADIPININSNTLTLTLPAENRASSFLLPIYPYVTYSSSPSSLPPIINTAHPYDRRRSMVDGICSYPSPMVPDYTNAPIPAPSCSHIFRAPPISNPYSSSFNAFQPRFSSPQALETILSVRNTRHGSHPLPPIPSTLLSMLNISANHRKDESVDKIFARYHKKHQQQHTQPQHSKSTEGKGNNSNAKKAAGNTNNRRKAGNNGGYNNNNQQNSNNYRHHPDNNNSNKNAPRRRSSAMEWPTISTSTPTISASTEPSSWTAEQSQAQHTRRWSTTKKQSQPQQQNEEARKKTLAEIVRIASPLPSPTIKQKPSSSPAPVSTTSSKSSSSSNRHRRRNNNNNKSTNNTNNKQKKKKSITATTTSRND